MKKFVVKAEGQGVHNWSVSFDTHREAIQYCERCIDNGDTVTFTVYSAETMVKRKRPTIEKEYISL